MRTDPFPSPSGARTDQQPWFVLDATDVLEQFGVNAGTGLTTEAVDRSLAAHGGNVLAEARRTPALRRLVSLLADRLTLVLVAAAIVSAVVSREWETPVVILLVIVLNTTLNFIQENRAENSLEALRSSSTTTSLVRRNGEQQEIPSTDIVPGDIVLLEAGDAVPADGRIIEAVRFQAAEASLTGESQPVEKTAERLDDEDLPAADRTNMAYMSTEVTRGRAVIVVTDTGMSTQIGAVATQLGTAGVEKTPLQVRTDQLANMLTIVALVVVTVVFVLGLVRGQPLAELLTTAVSLAVATIPEGLTAVVAFTLAMGASRLARRGAIVRRLAAVETLGSTSHIATDKTGTLTLNQMTVRQFVVGGRRLTVSGEGYSTSGAILSSDGRTAGVPIDTYLAMALCSDATVSDGVITGDPTEAALVVLAEKGGVDVGGTRRSHPRLAEIPFDSDYKFMATFHEQSFAAGDSSPARFRCFAKGAPDVLSKRLDSYLDDEGIHPLTDEDRARLKRLIDELAVEGLRTLMLAGRRIDTALPEDPDELRNSLDGLTLYAVVGILDPARREVAGAIATARDAGITIHMITGDGEVTARAIAQTLGIPGTTAEGRSLNTIDDQQLIDHAGEYGVLARVSPEHKIRFVRALQDGGAVVAMTGDGVNDAPALKQADIGIAMGITGTDVSKGAAQMILTDDNFSTIVAAVEEGRGIYANIIKFVKFQLTTAWGFVLIFLASSVFGIAGGAPFTALQILLVNLIMDGPPALALGVDPVEPGIMKDKPRPVREPLLTRNRLARILFLGLIMATGTLTVLISTPQWYPEAAQNPLITTSLAFTTFVFFQIFNILNVRSEQRSVFTSSTFSNRGIWISIIAVIIIHISVINVELLQDLFDTTALTSAQWLTAILIASSVLWVEEIRKFLVRRRTFHQGSRSARAAA